MNIRNIGGLNPTDPSRQQAIEGPGQSTPQPQTHSAQTPGLRDSVELSATARTNPPERSHVQEIEFARKALEASSVNETRLADIRQRLQEGYYTQPEVMSKIAERMADQAMGSGLIPADLDL